METSLSTVKAIRPAEQSDADIVFESIEARGRVGWAEIARTAYESLLANRVRSFLTMLGVIIGVASVIALLAIGTGATSSITSQVQSIGTNVLTLLNGSPSNQGPGGGGGASQNLSIDDEAALEALKLPVNGIAPQFQSSSSLVAPSADKSATVVGTTAVYQTLNNFSLKSGKFFDDAQNKSAAAVIVLGSALAKDLFGAGDAVGLTVRVDGHPLRVIGVLNAKGGGGFGSSDSQAYVPIKYAYLYFASTHTPDGNHYRVSGISISVTRADDITAVQDRIKTLLRERHHLPSDGTKDDFQIINQASILSTLSTITTILTYFLGAVASISLLVGGIGIMNIMLVSVTERTKEIGLRKAVGARGPDVLLQFLVEAVVLSLTGGLVGLAIGAGLAALVNLTGLLTTSVSPSSVALALGFAVAVGVFFGFYPAQRASRLNPIDALRSE